MFLKASTGAGTGNTFTTSSGTVGDACAASGGAYAYAVQNNDLVVPVTDPLPADTTGIIINIAVGVYAYSDGTGEITNAIYSSGTRNSGTLHALTGSYAYYTDTWATNPFNSNNPWTWSDVFSLQAGGRTSKGTGNPTIFVDSVQVAVTYSGPPDIWGNGYTTNLDTSSYTLTDGTGRVMMNFLVYDVDGGNVTTSVKYFNGSGWAAISNTYLSGDIGTVPATSSSTVRQIMWDVKTQFGSSLEASDYNVRIFASDGTYTDSVSRTANDLMVDTYAPRSYTLSSPTDGSNWPGKLVTLSSTLATDLHTVYYKFDFDTILGDLTPGNPWYESSGWQRNDNDYVTSPLPYDAMFRWRVTAKDTFGNIGMIADTFTYQVSNTRPNLVIDSAVQMTDGSGYVKVYYDLTDPQQPAEVCNILCIYSYDNFATPAETTWVATVSAGTISNKGRVTNLTPPQSDQWLTWDTKNSGNTGGAFSGEDATVWVQIKPNDGTEDGVTIKSLSFSVDNQAPTGVTCRYPADLATNQSTAVTCTCNVSEGMNPALYYFQYATNASFSPEASNSGWTSNNYHAPTLSSNTTYYWRVKAKDNYGNESGYSASRSFTTLSGWSFNAGGACTAPAVGNNVVYVGTGGADDSVYCLSTSNGTVKWRWGQANSDVHNVICCYHPSAGKYAVYFTCSGGGSVTGRLYGLWDDGASFSPKFAVDIGKNPISEPMIDPGGDYLYLLYNNEGRKYSASDGTLIPGWQTGNIGAATSSSLVVDNSYVYFPGTANTYKYAVDFTSSASAAHGCNLPMGLWSGRLYTPLSSSTTLYAINVSNMGDAWSRNIGTNISTGVMRAYNAASDNKLYVAAGSVLYKLNTAGGATLGSYTAGNTIQSTPVMTSDGKKIFFGCNDSKGYGIDSTMAVLSTWNPQKNTGAAVQYMPAVDEANGMVIFGSSNGYVYGYPVQ